MKSSRLLPGKNQPTDMAVNKANSEGNRLRFTIDAVNGILIVPHTCTSPYITI
jgi:hypothetical protein